MWKLDGTKLMLLSETSYGHKIRKLKELIEQNVEIETKYQLEWTQFD